MSRAHPKGPRRDPNSEDDDMQRFTFADLRMAMAQLSREGRIVATIPPVTRNSRRVYVASVHANEAEREAARRARKAWEAAGCPVYTERDLPLFEDGAEACD